MIGQTIAHYEILEKLGEGTAVVADDLDKDNPRISPDGKWLAYCSNETGTYQVYVVPYPPNGGRYQVSTSEASFPLWSRNGKELFYLVGDDQLVSTAVETKDGVLRLGQTQTLFRTRLFVITENPFGVPPRRHPIPVHRRAGRRRVGRADGGEKLAVAG